MRLVDKRIIGLAFHLLVALLVLRLSAPAIAAQQAKQPVYAVVNVTPTNELLKLEGVVLNNLPKEVKPVDPTQSRFAVFTVVLQSESDALIDLNLGDFVLEYELAGAKASAAGAGINIWEDQWSFDQKGFFLKMKPAAAKKVAFVLPKSVVQVAFKQRQPDGSFKTVRSGLSVSSSKK